MELVARPGQDLIVVAFLRHQAGMAGVVSWQFRQRLVWTSPAVGVAWLSSLTVDGFSSGLVGLGLDLFDLS